MVVGVCLMHRAEKRQYRAVKQIPVVEVLKQAQRKAEQQSPDWDHERSLQLCRKRCRRNPVEQEDCEGKLHDYVGEQGEERHIVLAFWIGIVSVIQVQFRPRLVQHSASEYGLPILLCLKQGRSTFADLPLTAIIES